MIRFVRDRDRKAWEVSGHVEARPLDPAGEGTERSIGGVWCFTGLAWEDDDGTLFFEDCDGYTPIRYTPDTPIEEVERLAAWWIWHCAHKYGGVAFIEDDGRPIYSWYTDVYPHLRTN